MCRIYTVDLAKFYNAFTTRLNCRVNSTKIKPFLNLRVNIPKFWGFRGSHVADLRPKMFKVQKGDWPSSVQIHTVLHCYCFYFRVKDTVAVEGAAQECILWGIMPRVTTPSCFATFLTSPKFLGQTSEKYVFRCLTVPVFKFTFKVSDSNGLVNFDPHFWGQRNLTTSTLFISRVMRRIWYKQRRNYGNNNPCHLIYHQSNNGFWRDSLLCIFSWISKWFPSTEKLGNFAPVSKVLQSFAMDCRGGELQQSRKVHEAILCLAQRWMVLWPVQNISTLHFCTILPCSTTLFCFAYFCYCLAQLCNVPTQDWNDAQHQGGRGAVSWRTTDLLEFFSCPCQPQLGELHLRPPGGSYQGSKCTWHGTFGTRCYPLLSANFKFNSES